MAAPKQNLSSRLFKKDENTLPFFSFHPKTRIGTILRVVLLAFMLLWTLMSVIGNTTGIVPAKYWDWSLLVYVVPAFLIFGLVIVALFKRIKTPAGKILTGIICGFILMFALTFVSTVMSVSPLLSVSSTGISNPSPEIRLSVQKDDVREKLVLMRAYTIPQDYIESDTEDPSTHEKQRLYPLRTEVYRYSALGADGEACSAEGEILINKNAKYEVKYEWKDENTVRFYPESETASAVKGEITVRFSGGGSSFPDENARLVRSFTNAQGTHSASLYVEDSYSVDYVSVYSLSKDALGKRYVAYPSIGYQLLKANTRVEGFIDVEPYGALSEIAVDVPSPRVLHLTPGENALGASGEIFIYLDEKAPKNREDAGADADAAPAEGDTEDTGAAGTAETKDAQGGSNP